MVHTEITVEGLRKGGYEPHWFGLGFIQMKLNESERIHFWHPELQADVPEEEVHDHRYDFTSTIVAGELVHEVYGFRGNLDRDIADHELVHVSCDPHKAVPENLLKPRIGELDLYGTHTMVAGSRYFFPARRFHKTKPSRAVTLLTRGPIQHEFARVIRPIGSLPVCPFSNPKSVSVLWDYIADLLPLEEKKPGYHLTPIAKGVVGEASKIREELEELEDAIEQGVKVMAMVELSDLIGAIDLYLKKHAPDISLDDLIRMNNVTQRAFRNGSRN